MGAVGLLYKGAVGLSYMRAVGLWCKGAVYRLVLYGSRRLVACLVWELQACGVRDQ